MAGQNKTGRTITGAILLTIVIFCIGGCILMLKELLTPIWIPLVITLAITLPLALPLRPVWRWLTGSENVAINILCHIVAIWPLILSIALLVNKCNPREPEREIDVTIERLYRETRYKTRRVSRRVYARGAPYYVYCAELNLPGDKQRDFDIKKKYYDRLMKGDTVGIITYKGILGMQIINASSLHLKKTQTNERKAETSREKRHRKYKERIDKIRAIKKNNE